jgi:hypothetical protein
VHLHYPRADLLCGWWWWWGLWCCCCWHRSLGEYSREFVCRKFTISLSHTHCLTASLSFYLTFFFLFFFLFWISFFSQFFKYAIEDVNTVQSKLEKNVFARQVDLVLCTSDLTTTMRKRHYVAHCHDHNTYFWIVFIWLNLKVKKHELFPIWVYIQFFLLLLNIHARTSFFYFFKTVLK